LKSGFSSLPLSVPYQNPQLLLAAWTVTHPKAAIFGPRNVARLPARYPACCIKVTAGPANAHRQTLRTVIINRPIVSSWNVGGSELRRGSALSRA